MIILEMIEGFPFSVTFFDSDHLNTVRADTPSLSTECLGNKQPAQGLGRP